MNWRERYSAKRAKPRVLPTVSDREELIRHLIQDHGHGHLHPEVYSRRNTSDLIFRHESHHDDRGYKSRVFNPYNGPMSYFYGHRGVRHQHTRESGQVDSPDFDFKKYDTYIQNKAIAKKAGIRGSQYEMHAWHGGIPHEDLIDAQRMFGSISFYGIGRKITTRYPEKHVWHDNGPNGGPGYETIPAKPDPSFEPMTHEHFKDIYSRGIPIKWYTDQRRYRKGIATHNNAVNKWNSLTPEKRYDYRLNAKGAKDSPAGLKVWPSSEERHPDFFPGGEEEKLLYSDAEHRGN